MCAGVMLAASAAHRVVGKRRVGKRAREPRQQPVPVHRRMPVVAAVERRRQLVRRLDVGRRVQHVRDLVGILLLHARERELCKAASRLHVELGRRRRCLSEKERGKQDGHAAILITAGSPSRGNTRCGDWCSGPPRHHHVRLPGPKPSKGRNRITEMTSGATSSTPSTPR